MAFQNYKTEIILDVSALMWLLFVLTNANQNLGNAYLHFIEIGVAFLFIEKIFLGQTIDVTFQKKQGGTFEAFLSGFVGWVILLALSFIVLQVVTPLKASFGSIVASLGAANPAFANSAIINFITVGVVLAYAETQLWARSYELIQDLRHGIPITRANIMRTSLLTIITLLSIAFYIFHITAKGISNQTSLITVFIMMFISLAMVTYYNGETRQAVFLHVIANSAAAIILFFGGGLIT